MLNQGAKVELTSSITVLGKGVAEKSISPAPVSGNTPHARSKGPGPSGGERRGRLHTALLPKRPHRPGEAANKPQSDITQHIHTVCLHRGALFTVDIYSIHIYIHTHCSTHSSQEEQSRWTGSSPLPVTVRWCGGFRPCVRHKGLLHARRPDSYRPDLPSRFPPTRIPL